MSKQNNELPNMTEDELRINKQENEAFWAHESKKYQFAKPECKDCYQSDDEIYLCPKCEELVK